MGLPSPESDRAFSDGCDARLAGRPLSANPYRASVDYNLWHKWREGWLDVETHWCSRATPTGRKSLPPVKG